MNRLQFVKKNIVIMILSLSIAVLVFPIFNLYREKVSLRRQNLLMLNEIKELQSEINTVDPISNSTINLEKENLKGIYRKLFSLLVKDKIELKNVGESNIYFSNELLPNFTFEFDENLWTYNFLQTVIEGVDTRMSMRFELVHKFDPDTKVLFTLYIPGAIGFNSCPYCSEDNSELSKVSEFVYEVSNGDGSYLNYYAEAWIEFDDISRCDIIGSEVGLDQIKFCIPPGPNFITRHLIKDFYNAEISFSEIDYLDSIENSEVYIFLNIQKTNDNHHKDIFDIIHTLTY